MAASSPVRPCWSREQQAASATLASSSRRHAGARVLGTGSSRNRDFVLGLGADEYVDYTEQDVGEAVSDVDVAFDTVGGPTTESLLPTLRDGGILVTIAAAPPREAAQARGVRAEVFSSRSDPQQLARIAELVAAGKLEVELAEVLPLRDVQRAHELSESGTHAREDRPHPRSLAAPLGPASEE